jgi:hypothetical protein
VHNAVFRCCVAVFEILDGGVVFSPLLAMALAMLLPHIRTDAVPLIWQICVAATVVGFSTTKTILANRAQTIHSLRGLMKRSSFAQNSSRPRLKAMDY